MLKLKHEGDNGAGVPLYDAVELAKLRAEKAIFTTQIPNEVVEFCCKPELVFFYILKFNFFNFKIQFISEVAARLFENTKTHNSGCLNKVTFSFGLIDSIEIRESKLGITATNW